MCGENNAGSSGISAPPTTSSGAMSTGGAKFSSDTVAIQVKLPSQHTCRKLIDAQDYRGRFIIFETMYKETPEISFDSDTARMLIVSTLDTMFPNAIHKTC